MPTEISQYIATLNDAYPLPADRKTQGDDHLRLLKNNLIGTFPNMFEAMTVTSAKLNEIDANILATSPNLVLTAVTAGEAAAKLSIAAPSVTVHTDLIPQDSINSITELSSVAFTDARQYVRESRQYYRAEFVAGVSGDIYGFSTPLSIGSLTPATFDTRTIKSITVDGDEFKIVFDGAVDTDLQFIIIGTTAGVISLDVSTATVTVVTDTEILWTGVTSQWFTDGFESDVQFLFKKAGSTDKTTSCYSAKEIDDTLTDVTADYADHAQVHLAATRNPLTGEGNNGDIFFKLRS